MDGTDCGSWSLAKAFVAVHLQILLLVFLVG